MREIFALIRRLGDSRSSVLITGESGTGKEVVARTIHFTGARSKAPFVPVNCTAIPEGLLESELFGHVRGAFTRSPHHPARPVRGGGGGTLFLDEIGDMGPSLQGKLLRVLQDREVRPVGGNTSVKVDVRIIAATNKELREEIDAGRFRTDLYYRLNVIPIHIPPLQERPEDVALLAEHFLRKHSPDRPRGLSPGALEVLKRRPWEGNARSSRTSSNARWRCATVTWSTWGTCRCSVTWRRAPARWSATCSPLRWSSDSLCAISRTCTLTKS